MLIFQPFGLYAGVNYIGFLFLLGYGVVTFVVLTLILKVFPLISPKIFHEKNWKVKHEIVLLISIIFFIGIGNLIYTKILFDYPSNLLKGFLLFEMYTLSIGTIPIITLVMLSQIRLLKKNLRSAAQVNKQINVKSRDIDEEEKITITSNNKNEMLSISPSNLLAIKSEGNYVDLFYKDESKIYKKMFRSSLKRMQENYFSKQPFFQCHRAYIINTNMVKKAEGNSQGFLLEIDGLEFKIPVSRNYVTKFKTIFN